MSAGTALLRALRRELARRADPGKAAAMRAYMKSPMPYYGVQTPDLREILRETFDAHPMPDAVAWRAAALAIWRGARFREERYAAISLTGRKEYAPFQTLATLPMYEEMIVTGAWWDYVDGIASNRLGPLLRVRPATMKRRMRQWSRCDDLWKRRAAILCQLGCKNETDRNLLYGCI
jgi:3-methyladenine DNA glycosylase AlkD